jgi:hypothetical protein
MKRVEWKLVAYLEEVMSPNSSGEIEEKHDKPESGQPYFIMYKMNT